MMITSSFPKKCISVINGAPTWAVFFLLDILDDFLCIVFRFLDQIMEEKSESCHCINARDFAGYEFLSDHQYLSETLYRRRNIFRQAGYLRFARRLPEITKKIGIVTFLRGFLFPAREHTGLCKGRFGDGEGGCPNCKEEGKPCRKAMTAM
ncbi:hypothetical protein Bca101_026065 [Brassica carinata]